MSAQADITTNGTGVASDCCPEAAPSLRAWDEEPMMAWTGFHAAHHRLIRSLEQELIGHHSIGLSGYKLLARLVDAEDGHARMSELADDAQLSPSRVSRLVDQLVARGYLERTRCPSDSRVVWAALTDAGREFLGDVHATYVETVEREFFARLPERDVKALARALARLA